MNTSTCDNYHDDDDDDDDNDDNGDDDNVGKLGEAPYAPPTSVMVASPPIHTLTCFNLTPACCSSYPHI